MLANRPANSAAKTPASARLEPSNTVESPDPSVSHRPDRKSSAILIKDANGVVLDIGRPKSVPSPAIVTTSRAADQSESSASSAKETRIGSEQRQESAEERRKDFIKKFQLRLQQEAEEKAAEAARQEEKRKEDEQFDIMVAEIEAAQAKEDEQERKYVEEQKRKKAVEDKEAKQRIRAQDEAFRRAEALAEAKALAAEIEREDKTSEQEIQDREMFASLKKNTWFGPGATG